MQEITSPKLNHYALRKELTRKAGRRTFLAEDSANRLPVIVKILSFGEAFQWEDLKLFKREGNILQHLAHPTIPQYRESFEAEIEGVFSFVLVQTYIAAPSLQNVVESGKLFSEKEVISIAHSLLSTLSYLHKQLPPVVHRDIKPSNILISQPNSQAVSQSSCVIEDVYLVDFGAVQIAASKEGGTVTIVGSYGYMPLEQFLGQTTPQSDLYSLGMTLLYLITGTHPAELPQADGQVRVDKIAAAAGLRGCFSHWLSQMVAPYAENRFESAAIAQTRLNHLSDRGGYYPHLRPANAKLILHRHPDELIIFSSPSPDRSLISCSLFPPILFMSFGLLSSLIGAIALIAIPTVWVCAWIYDYYQTKKRLNRYALISISCAAGIRSGTAIGPDSHHLSRVKWSGKNAPFDSISLATYCPDHTFKRYYHQRQNTYEPGCIRIPPKLSIHAGQREYSLEVARLSLEEHQWISTELNDFLGIPLRAIAPKEDSALTRAILPKPSKQSPH